jgi:F0F1-type ATP synthase membrane subunit b/b'
MTPVSEVGITLNELIAVAVVIVGALWALGKIGMGQYMKRMDDRFKEIDSKLRTFDPLHGELARVDKDLIQVRLEMATTYVRQDGIRQLTKRMEDLFKEVFDKLENKADKSECASHHGDRRQ